VHNERAAAWDLIYGCRRGVAAAVRKGKGDLEGGGERRQQ